MVTALQVAGISITAVLLAKMLQRYAAEQAMLLTLLLGTMLTAAAIVAMTPVLTQIDTLLSAGGLDPQQTACITKTIGICCITQLAADVCRDAGESALTTAVLLTGKIALQLLALPMIAPLTKLLEEVLHCTGLFG